MTSSSSAATTCAGKEADGVYEATERVTRDTKTVEAEHGFVRQYVRLLDKWYALAQPKETQDTQEMDLAAARRFEDAAPSAGQWFTDDDTTLLAFWAAWLTFVAVAVAWALATFAPEASGRARAGAFGGALSVAILAGVATVRSGTGPPRST